MYDTTEVKFHVCC